MAGGVKVRKGVRATLKKYDYFEKQEKALKESLTGLPPEVADEEYRRHYIETGMITLDMIRGSYPYASLGVDSFVVIDNKDAEELINELIAVIRGVDAKTIVRVPILDEAKRILGSLLPDGPGSYGGDDLLEWHADKLIEELKKL